MQFEGEEFIQQLLENIIKDIIKDMKGRGMEATGKTRRLFEVLIETDGKYLLGHILGPSYMQSLITGRGPSLGSGGQSQTLQQSILEWIEAKGIIPQGEMSQESLSWAIATHIHKYGTLLHQTSGDTGLLKNHITESRLIAAVDSFGDANAEAVFIGINDLLK